MNRIPRSHTEYVKGLLENDNFTLEEKAQLIKSYDYDLACRETDGMIPKLMNNKEIETALREYYDI